MCHAIPRIDPSSVGVRRPRDAFGYPPRVSSASEVEGQLLAGRYRVGERVGEGGMGAVYRATDERLRREVAVKLLPPQAVGDAAARERLRREALFGASIEHPGIAHVYDVGDTDDGGAFLVMELVKGASLRALIKSDAWNDRARVFAIVETARALGAAHRAGLVHRDVKPDNVMLRSDGRVVLLDFGIAKPGLGEGVAPLTLTARGSFIGTPAYLAPEQAHGKPADARTDQFALAVTAYEVLARVLPWPTSSGLRLLTAILSEPPPPLQVSTDPALSENLQPVLERALSKEPTDRYPDIDAFADALAEAGGVTSSVKPDPSVVAEALPSPSASTVTVLSRTDGRTSTAPTPGGARSWRRWALTALGVTAAAAASVVAWRSQRNPLAVADPVLACVPFEGRDHGTPAAWLGAAGAFRFCDYAAPALGGMHRHVRFPADLLDLPHLPAQDFPEDPYEARDARERAVAEARRRGLPYADGSVDASDAGFQVHVSLHAAGGRLLGDATGSGDTLGEATGAALDALVATASLPARAELDPDVSEVFGPRSVREAMMDARLPFEVVYFGRSKALERLCAATAPRPPGRAGAAWRRECEGPGPGAETPPTKMRVVPAPPPLSDVGALLEYATETPGLTDEDRARIMTGFDALLPSVRDPSIRAIVKETEGDLASENDVLRWEANDLAAAALDPRVAATADQGFDLNQVRESDGLGPRTAAAWAPDRGEVWRGRSLSRRPADVARGLDWTARWYLLDPSGGADNYGIAALRAGRIDLALRVAARLAMSDLAKDRAESMLLENLALAAKSDMARAYESFVRNLPDGPLDAATLIGIGYMRHLALILGRERELADAVVDRYVREGYPLAWTYDGGTGAGKLAAICAFASPDKARRCLATLRERARASVFGSVEMVDAAERWVAGDVDGAGQAARRAMRQPWNVIRNGDFLVTVLDAAKLYDLADTLDAPQAAQRGIYNGEDWFTVLRARRAFARGDRETGRKLARRIVDAWKLADTPVPAVAEMEHELAQP
jgi:predicted Ser/Thr protein kinase